MPADTLYEDDIVAWAEQQAQAMRTLARNRPELSNAIDWRNLAQEMDALGRTEMRAFTGPLRQFLTHLAKALSSRATSIRHWRTECITFHYLAREAFTNLMRRKIDIDDLWQEALRQADSALAAYDEALADDMKPQCPLTLEELLEKDLTLDMAVALASQRLGRTSQSTPISKDLNS